MLSKGDRVRRAGEYRFGTVTEVYYSKPSHIGQVDTQYAVMWEDTGYEERGYLECGLERVYSEVSVGHGI